MQHNELTLSVIMSVYETPVEYLHESIDSILNQTFREYEFIIIDDGCSNQDTVSCLKEYSIKDSRIKLIRNSENIGLTKSLNVGLDSCQGKYIARIDADDISMPERFAIQIEYMETHPEVSLLGANSIGFDGDKILFDESKINSRVRRPEIAEIRMLVQNTGFAHSTYMMRKSFLFEHGIRYNESLRYAQDYAITTDIILNDGKIHRIEKSLLKYREHEGQISNGFNGGQMECSIMTASKRLFNTFEGLSERECRIISQLPYNDSEYSPKETIMALKSMFQINRHLQKFNKYLFEREFRYYWYKKIMHVSKAEKKPWGVFKLFSICSVPSIISVKKEEHRYKNQ